MLRGAASFRPTAARDRGRTLGAATGRWGMCGVLFMTLMGLQVRLGAAQLPPARVEGVAAVVGGHHPSPGVDVLLRSDVELWAQLAMAERGYPMQRPSSGLLQASLQELVSELLIVREARRVELGEPSASDVAQERRRLVERVGGGTQLAAILDRVGATPAEIELIVERRAQVGLFLSANLVGVDDITPAAVDAELRNQGVSEPAEVSPERREQVRQALADEALRRVVARWAEVLRARSVVRVLAYKGGDDG